MLQQLQRRRQAQVRRIGAGGGVGVGFGNFLHGGGPEAGVVADESSSGRCDDLASIRTESTANCALSTGTLKTAAARPIRNATTNLSAQRSLPAAPIPETA